ncbi:MAG: NADH-quinone oxidoreductase subunit NuoN [Thiothrix sp.]|nr:MAG: NADH-quinone oxidoreductase subunit NuoN [Thiothrix sp.]
MTAMPDFSPAVPEIFMLIMICTVLLVDVFLKPEQRNVTYVLAQASLVGALILTMASSGDERILTFSDRFVRDPMGDVLKVFIYIITIGVFLYSRDYLKERGLFKGEYYVLGLFAVLGMMVMVSAHSFLTLYLGLELLSLSLYALVAFDRDNGQASEAAMKYFVLGALASGMLLYGMSIIYGLTGSLDISQVHTQITTHAGEGQARLGALFGLSFIIVGIAFKLGAVPFHMWVPDVYHGAPTSVAMFVGTAPKIAAFAMVMRLLVEGMGSLHADWQQMLVLLAILSIGLGNVAAIAQTNIKRMFAYSTISHVGFILLGILAGTREGYASSMFYTLVYAITSLGGFGMILLLSRKGFEADEIEDFKGLNDRNPWYAFIFMILLISMIGVPGTAGFIAKLSVLQAVIGVDRIGLAVFAVILSVVGAFYYLRVIKVMYFDKPEDDVQLSSHTDVNIVLSANSLIILLLGIFPNLLMSVCFASM